MTNNNNNKKKQNQLTRSNPVSYNHVIPSGANPGSRVFSGSDIIVDDAYGNAGSTFNAREFQLNPRLPLSFPSGHFNASRYDTYCFEELEFRYHPTTAVTDTPGILYLAWEPNANRGVPANIAQVNAYEFHSEGPIYNPNITLRIPRIRLMGMRYTRRAPTSSDLNFYDTGRLIVVTDKAASSVGGYVEVRYRVRYMNYHLEDTLLVQNRAADFLSDFATPQTLTTGVKTRLELALNECFNSEDCIQAGPNPGEYILPAGKYMVTVHSNSQATAGGVTAANIELQRDGTLVPGFWSQVNQAASTFASNAIAGILEVAEGQVIALYKTITGTGTLTDVATRLQITAL